MSPPRLSDATKRLHGTTHKRPAAPVANVPRLMRPIPPPKDMAPEVRAAWKLHMSLVVASGRMASVDLAAFRQLCQAAHGVDMAYQQAVRDGPTESGQNNEPKAGTAWRMWLATMAQYRAWLDAFGLTPKGRGGVPQLAASPAELHVIEGRQ
jgi:Phage terminase, small subunit